MTMSEIEKLMNDIIELPTPISVYNVSLNKKDCSGNWNAWASLRPQGDFSASEDTPEKALLRLYWILRSLTCQHCGQMLPKKEK
jgi:hypothetical protein